MRTDLHIKVGVAALILVLTATPAAHARDTAVSDGARGAEANDTTGRSAGTLADYTALIRRRPRDASGYRARGQLNLTLGKAGAAAADLEQAVRLKPADAYNALWLHLARNKEGAPDAAELEINAARANRAVWPGPLLDYLTGKINASAVLAKAGEGQGEAKAARLCEADLFLGQDDLANGRRSLGQERLQAARACDGAPKLTLADLHGVAKPAPASASNLLPKAIEAVLKPASVKSAPQLRVAETLPGDPLMLRGSLK